MTSPVLDITGLSIDLRTRRGVVHAVDHVGFGVRAGETLAIVGESGSGKSVTVRSIIGLMPPQLVWGMGRRAGTVNFMGEDLLAASDRHLSSIRGREIGIVFQDPMSSLNPVMRVGDQVAEPLRRHLGMSKSQALKRAVELLDEVKIPACLRANQFLST